MIDGNLEKIMYKRDEKLTKLHVAIQLKYMMLNEHKTKFLN